MATPPTSGTTSTTDSLAIGYVDVLSDDGTRLRAWTNDPAGTTEGPTVLLCNGLGTVPSSWPGLIERDSGFRVVTWYQRGTFASARPGQSISHIPRDTAPWTRDTPTTRPDSRMATAVIWKR